MDPVVAARELERLGRVLPAEGWATEPHRLDRVPRLRVFDPDTPRFGDRVGVTDGPGGEPWFVSSTEELVSPVWDLPCAVERIGKLIETFRPLARRLGLAGR
ncbi:hypothetical protein GCM10010411_45990 [Actinomadura fulvescens]|uniref:Uncharacterized protein n=1 Tax=Actinomadura fulvescens TaxID=46160 RepID=A0ABN3PXM0_9ACTN